MPKYLKHNLLYILGKTVIFNIIGNISTFDMDISCIIVSTIIELMTNYVNIVYISSI